MIRLDHILLACMLPFLIGWSPGSAAEKLSRPPLADVEIAALQREYKAQISGFETNGERYALARTLFEQGAGTEDNIARQYALFRVSRDLVVDSGDAENALIVVNEIADRFDVDRLAMQADTLDLAAKKLRSEEQYWAFSGHCVRVIESAIVADRFDVAKRIVEFAYSSARKGRESRMISRLVVLQRRVIEMATEHEQVEPVLRALEVDPIDPDANCQVGQYRCFRLGDWTRGLPMLALGSDSAHRKLALVELRGATGQAVVELADGWWDVAEQQSDSLAKQNVQLHAGQLYRQLLSSLSGQSKVRAQQRTADVDTIIAETAILPANALLVMTFDRGTFTGKVGKTFSKDFSGRGHRGFVFGAQLASGKVGDALSFDGKDDYVECLTASDLDPTDAMTVCAWVFVRKWNRSGASATVFISKDDWKAGPKGFVLRALQSHLDFTYSSNRWHSTRSTAQLGRDQWYHIAATHGDQGVRVYLDGVESGADVESNAIVPSTFNLLFGRSAFNNKRGLDGMIDEVAMFHRALEAEEIRVIYLMGMAGRSLNEG